MDDLRDRYLGLIAEAGDEAGIEDLRVRALGKKGEISGLMKTLGGMT
ncbi:MAG: phenylalanine--tRNA ligase subunit alpha, partial [Limimaricola soesokkakensis]